MYRPLSIGNSNIQWTSLLTLCAFTEGRLRSLYFDAPTRHPENECKSSRLRPSRSIEWQITVSPFRREARRASDSHVANMLALCIFAISTVPAWTGLGWLC
jgi:hypothetical protein